MWVPPGPELNRFYQGLSIIERLSAGRPLTHVPHRSSSSPSRSMTRGPYTGASRKLVLAFDIGTTYSGAAYALLDPDQVPEITSVTR